MFASNSMIRANVDTSQTPNIPAEVRNVGNGNPKAAVKTWKSYMTAGA
jgi:hypothetical protein